MRVVVDVWSVVDGTLHHAVATEWWPSIIYTHDIE